MSVVYYVPTDGDELLVSTMPGRSKAFAVGRDPKVSRSAWRLARSSKAEQEQRVVLRCRPYSTFAQPPRHLERNDQTEGLTHWTSGSVPWDAPDP